jgi:hypothetical protein
MIMDPVPGGSKTIDPYTGCYRCVRAEFSSQILSPSLGGYSRLWHKIVLPARQDTLIKKKTKFSSYTGMRESRRERLQSNI